MRIGRGREGGAGGGGGVYSDGVSRPLALSTGSFLCDWDIGWFVATGLHI